MQSLALIVAPKWRTTLARARQGEGGAGKALVIGIVGLVFWLAVFGVLYRVLSYFRGVEEIGPLLAGSSHSCRSCCCPT